MANYVEEERERLQKAARSWAQGKQPYLAEIEKTGSVSPWTYFKNIPSEIADWTYLQFAESPNAITQPGEKSLPDRRNEAYEAAKKRAEEVYKINQENLRLERAGQKPKPKPAPVGTWDLLMRDGLY